MWFCRGPVASAFLSSESNGWRPMDKGGQRICLLATKTHKLTIKGRPKPFEWTQVVTRCSPASQCEHFHGYLEK